MITDVEEETLDITWFSVDANGEIACFASGGRGFLPASVKACKDNMIRLVDFFEDALPENGYGIASLNLDSRMQQRRYLADTVEEGRASYLAAYLPMATKGLYAFDCIYLNRRPSGYFLVARPSRPLCVGELPPDIQGIVKLTRFPGRFSTLDTVQEADFG